MNAPPERTPVLAPSPRERTIGPRDLTDWRSRAGQALSRLFGALADRFRNVEAAALVLIALAGGLVVGATVITGEIYEAVTEQDGIAIVDRPLLNWMLTVRSPGQDAVIAAFSNSGGQFWMPIVAGGGVGLLCWLWRRWTPLVLMLITVAGSLAMTVVGKRLTDRARPPLEQSIPPYETSASFPSGHALNSIVIAGMLCYLLLSHLTSRLARTLTVLVGVLYVAAMGLSRVYLAHHWFTDVLAAWALGVAWLTVVITSHRLWLTQHSRHRLGPRRNHEQHRSDASAT